MVHICQPSHHPPIITVGQPKTITPPCAVWSPRRAAGILPIITVAEPLAIVSGGPTHTHMSPTRAAGKKPIITVGQPTAMGPPTWGTGPVDMGQVCISEIRAAGGMAILLDVYGFGLSVSNSYVVTAFFTARSPDLHSCTAFFLNKEK